MRATEALAQLGQEIADVLRLGAAPSTATLERWAKLHAAAGAVRWLTEEQAVRRGHHAKAWFRARFDLWEAMNYARLVNGKREYHEAVVPIEPRKMALAGDPVEQARRDAAA